MKQIGLIAEATNFKAINIGRMSDLNEYVLKLGPGNTFTQEDASDGVILNEPGYEKLISTIFDTMATAAEMNAKGWLTPEEVHEYLRRITGREIDKSTDTGSAY